MRIGILTFHRSVNNGAVMQAYSLSKRLQEQYPDSTVEIVDYCTQKAYDNYHRSLAGLIRNNGLLGGVKRAVLLLKDPQTRKALRTQTEVFESNLCKLPLSEFSLVSDKTAELNEYLNRTYDVLIVGSDAIWNYSYYGFPSAYIPDEQICCAKMSYAASCYGMDFLKCAEDERVKIGSALQTFSFLGVRDTATEQFVQWSGCTKVPVHTCDPTVFLDVARLPVDAAQLEEKLRKRGFDLERPSIGMMGDERMLRMLRRMYGTSYQIVALYNPVSGADVDLYDLSPFEWAYVFRYFKLTFSIFFHGVLLSLRNGVPVVCIARQTEFSKVHTPKTQDILTRVKHPDWYFTTDYNGENDEQIKQTADTLLQAELHDAICAQMDAEAQSFCAFKNALDKLMENKRQNND